jgi:hypothetical protein
MSLDWCVALCVCGGQDLRDAGIVTMLMNVLTRVVTRTCTVSELTLATLASALARWVFRV